MKKICLPIISLMLILPCKAQTVENHVDSMQDSYMLENHSQDTNMNDANKIHVQYDKFHNDLNIDTIKHKNFIGIGVGESILNVDDGKQEKIQSIKELRKKFWNVYTGHQLNDSFSVKAEYVRLISIKTQQKSLPDFKLRALSFSGLGFYPVNRQTSVFAEAGIYVYRAKESYDDGIKSNQQNHGTKPFMGLGLKYDLGKSDLIVKYNNFGKVRNNFYGGKLSQIQFNVEYKF